MSDNEHKGSKSEKAEITKEEKIKGPTEETTGKQAESEDFIVSLVSQVKSVTILGQVLDEITEYSIRSIPKEAIGLLGGKELRPNELMITNILFVSEGDEVSVSFSEEDFKAFEEISEDDIFCLGWWHSHPGYGLFLSQTDISTHIFSFQLHNNLSVALVMEPTVIDTNGRAAFQFYQVIGEQGKSPFKHKEIASYIQQ